MATAPEKHETECPASEVFDFTLVLAGINEITPDAASALYDSGCSDALFGVQGGIVFLDFSRRSTSLTHAIVTAIQNVENAGIKGLEVSEVRPPDAAVIEIVNTLLECRHKIGAAFPAELLGLLSKR